MFKDEIAVPRLALRMAIRRGIWLPHCDVSFSSLGTTAMVVLTLAHAPNSLMPYWNYVVGRN